MKIDKFYESNNYSGDKSAIIFKKMLSNKFFNELEEFDKIHFQYDERLRKFEFYICFTEIFPETIEQIEKFNIFLGLNKNGWSFQIDEFDSEVRIFSEFHLNIESIEIFNDTKKYNL